MDWFPLSQHRFEGKRGKRERGGKGGKGDRDLNSSFVTKIKSTLVPLMGSGLLMQKDLDTFILILMKMEDSFSLIF
jgi:hypothetical protein